MNIENITTANVKQVLSLNSLINKTPNNNKIPFDIDRTMGYVLSEKTLKHGVPLEMGIVTVHINTDNNIMSVSLNREADNEYDYYIGLLRNTPSRTPVNIGNNEHFIELDKDSDTHVYCPLENPGETSYNRWSPILIILKPERNKSEVLTSMYRLHKYDDLLHLIHSGPDTFEETIVLGIYDIGTNYLFVLVGKNGSYISQINKSNLIIHESVLADNPYARIPKIDLINHNQF